MAIKKLQNNYTTPDQSKRLLELGVPADSADCYIDEWRRVHFIPQEPQQTLFSELQRRTIYTISPCWSAGRLIEIITICREWFKGQKYHSYVFQSDISPLETAIDKIEKEIKNYRINFSKLEE